VTRPSPNSLVTRAAQHAQRTAIVADDGTFSYQELLDASAAVASILLDGHEDLQEARVAFLVPPGFCHVKVQWGIWRAGGVAVPLCLSHPRPELEYVLKDSDCTILIAHRELDDVAQPLATDLGLRLLSTTELSKACSDLLPEVAPQRRAMILYTSGTTSRPKGVVSTHSNLEAQMKTLVDAWGWCAEDHILLVLPLHHVHGIVNVLCCALWSGAVCEMLPRFDARAVWERFSHSALTLFMGVPTVYTKLITEWERAPSAARGTLSATCSKLRLMVSGSAALPVSVLERWQSISGHVLLERYGMTEIGMALSNPLHGERRAGSVGTPLPGVEVRLIDEDGDRTEPDERGEIQVRGPTVFLEYWRQPDATREAFTDGWFQTGDVAVIEQGSYRILGRQSVDIIKTGGYKVSALEIEEVLRTHPDIDECAVVGLPDPEWGQRVAAAVRPRANCQLHPEELRAWAKSRIATYKVPTRLLQVETLPRNALGKVVKPELVKRFERRQ
jgi:malonyl-CoA/methylmalonyl-CoA synthetase